MGIHMEPENEHDLVNALVQLTDDKSLGETIGNAGHEYIVKHFDRDNLAGEYLDIITQIAKKENL